MRIKAVCMKKSLATLSRTLSSKTTPRPSAAAARQGLSLTGDTAEHEQHDRTRLVGTNTVRENRGLVEPKFKTHSFSMARTYDTHLMCDTVGERLAALAREKPNEVGYKFMLTKTSLKFAELKQRVDEVAQNFLKLGFKKGDRIALLLPNMPELVVNLLAASSIGLLVVLMNPAYQRTEIEFMLKKTRAKGILILDNLKSLQHYSIMRAMCPELESCSKGELKSNHLPELRHVILVKNSIFNEKTDQAYKGTWSFADDLQRYDRMHEQTPHVDFDDPFVMLFTSGTTGSPKGAVLSHFNLLNAAYLDIYSSNLIDESRIIACPIPIFHVFGLASGVLEPLVIGAKTVFPSFFPDTLALLKAIHAEKCTAIKGAPIIFLDLINHPERAKYDLSSLKYALLGASFVSQTLIDEVRRNLQIKYILPGYGLTESSAGATLCRANYEDNQIAGTVGESLPFTQLKIVDAKNNIVPVNTDGEICLRGYNVMKGYWEEPEKTAETIDSNGWLHTGDIGSMDENGLLHFKGRAKELIIRGGVNIYPAEIESFFRTHDKIVDVACFGVPDSRSGEEVCVWIKTHANVKLTKQDLCDFCQGKIAYFKIPKYVKFVDEFPINANGKVLKYKMLDQMKKEIAEHN